MLNSIISTSHVVLCLNNIFFNYISNDSQIVLVDFEEIFSFPSIRVNFDTSENLHLEDSHIYLFNRKKLIDEKYDELNEIIGIYGNSIFIFVEDNDEDISLNSTKNLFVLKISTGYIYQSKHSKNMGKENSIGNCYDTKNNIVGSMFSEQNPLQKRTFVTICISCISPYSFCPRNSSKKGLTIEITTMILSLLGLKPKYVNVLYPKKDVLKNINTIISRNICEIFTSNPGLPSLDYTFPYAFDSLNWIVKNAEEIPRWKYAFQIFSLSIWLIWLFSSICLSVMWYITKKCSMGYSSRIVEGFGMICSVFVEQSLSVEIPRFSQKIILVIILISTVFFNMFYKTKFSFLLSGFNFENSIDSFEDVMENSLTVQIPDRFAELYSNDANAMKYFEKHCRTTNAENAIEDVKHKENVATSYVKGVILYKTAKLKDFVGVHNRPLLKILEPPILNIFFCMVLSKRNPLTNLIDRNLKKLFYHGFVSHILSKYQIQSSTSNPEVDVKKLSLSSLQLAFILYFMGNRKIEGLCGNPRIFVCMVLSKGNFSTTLIDTNLKKLFYQGFGWLIVTKYQIQSPTANSENRKIEGLCGNPRIFVCMVLSKGNFSTTLIDTNLKKLFYQGFGWLIVTKYQIQSPTANSEVDVEKLSLSSLQLAFILYFMGVIASSVSYLLEIFYTKP
ncbi:hypothetical protein WA026_011855 [Henosepilachna vigintioctopunctata]|uniref:Uncharacterized protein n=1 Tax=Henosepilachna vigintioctopunctata TaxID=420089 RepID=A0AAW1UHE2_9CUCU